MATTARPRARRGPVRRALEKSLKQADHVTDMDEAAVATARDLADKIDAWHVIVGWALADAEGRGRPAVPPHDNVSHATFLRVLHQLGMTPEARGELNKKKRSSGKLAKLQEREQTRS